MRRIGVLVNLPADDPELQARVGAFLQGLQEFGWAIGRNVRIEYRWAADLGSISRYAAELVALAPDVILVNANPSVEALQRVTRTLPIVFVAVTEPVGSGVVESMARPGGNTTGFASARVRHEREMAGTAQGDRAPRDASGGASGSGVWRCCPIRRGPERRGLARGGLEFARRTRPRRDRTRDLGFASAADSGLIVARNALMITHRDLIIKLAAQYRLPTVYPLRFFVIAGGLISYGPDIVDQYRRAAGYVDRILKGEKPADLPVQAPTKYELVINLKTAKAIGFDLPPTVLARADEVIE